jgi:hypothetical protein
MRKSERSEIWSQSCKKANFIYEPVQCVVNARESPRIAVG